jgi:hypothetical protein
VAPFQVLSSLRDKQALAVSPGGASSLVRTPAGLPFESLDRSRVDGTLNETGKLTAHFNNVARGDSELGIRYAIRQVSNNRWKNLFEMMLEPPVEGW